MGHMCVCYGAGTTFCVYTHFRQQILTMQASTYKLCLIIVSVKTGRLQRPLVSWCCWGALTTLTVEKAEKDHRAFEVGIFEASILDHRSRDPTPPKITWVGKFCRCSTRIRRGKGATVEVMLQKITFDA